MTSSTLRGVSQSRADKVRAEGEPSGGGFARELFAKFGEVYALAKLF
jgi:hypothetical protein